MAPPVTMSATEAADRLQALERQRQVREGVLGKEVLASVPEKKQIRVTIVSAGGLRNADTLGSGKSDPYCAIEVEGVKGLTLRTKVIDDCLDPVWNEGLDFTDYVVGRSLVFKVWDKDPWPKSDDPLGHVTLGSDKFLPDGTGEEPLDLLLLDAGKGVKATLKVKVTILQDLEGNTEDVSTSIEAVAEISAGIGTVPVSLVPPSEVAVEDGVVANDGDVSATDAPATPTKEIIDEATADTLVEDAPMANPPIIASEHIAKEEAATSAVEEAPAEQIEAQAVDNMTHHKANDAVATSEKKPAVAAEECTPDTEVAIEEVPAPTEPAIEKKDEVQTCWRPGHGRLRRHLRNATCFGRGKQN